MRTLRLLILLPLVVLAPLLMAPTAYAIDVEPRPTVFAAFEGKLTDVDHAVTIFLQGFAIGTADSTVSNAANSLRFQLGDLPSGEAFFRVSRLSLIGAVRENIVALSGFVESSTDTDLLRTPVAITANATDGGIIFVFGPIPSGRLAGQTFTFKGVGTVIIVCLDCRSD